MTALRRSILVGCLILSTFANLSMFSNEAEAQAEASSAVTQNHARLEAELARPSSRARTQRLITQLDRTVDYAVMVRRILVVHWNTLDEAQRTEVVDLLTQAIRHRYRQSLEALSGWQVRVESEAPRGVGRQVVTVASRANETRRIAYDLYEGDDRVWRVVDISVEGGSLVSQHRTQFDRVIRREGVEGLLRRLRERVAEEAREDT